MSFFVTKTEILYLNADSELGFPLGNQLNKEELDLGNNLALNNRNL